MRITALQSRFGICVLSFLGTLMIGCSRGAHVVRLFDKKQYEGQRSDLSHRRHHQPAVTTTTTTTTPIPDRPWNYWRIDEQARQAAAQKPSELEVLIRQLTALSERLTEVIEKYLNVETHSTRELSRIVDAVTTGLQSINTRINTVVRKSLENLVQAVKSTNHLSSQTLPDGQAQSISFDLDDKTKNLIFQTLASLNSRTAQAVRESEPAVSVVNVTAMPLLNVSGSLDVTVPEVQIQMPQNWSDPFVNSSDYYFRRYYSLFLNFSESQQPGSNVSWIYQLLYGNTTSFPKFSGLLFEQQTTRYGGFFDGLIGAIQSIFTSIFQSFLDGLESVLNALVKFSLVEVRLLIIDIVEPVLRTFFKVLELLLPALEELLDLLIQMFDFLLDLISQLIQRLNEKILLLEYFMLAVILYTSLRDYIYVLVILTLSLLLFGIRRN